MGWRRLVRDTGALMPTSRPAQLSAGLTHMTAVLSYPPREVRVGFRGRVTPRRCLDEKQGQTWPCGKYVRPSLLVSLWRGRISVSLKPNGQGKIVQLYSTTNSFRLYNTS